MPKARGNHDRKLTVDVLVTQHAGDALRDRDGAGAVLVRNRYDHRERDYAVANRGFLPIVEARDLRKVFRTLKRAPGPSGALRSLFSRAYEERVAVDGVTFALEAGELVGYIGPNGAGKSTTIKMLTGILVPTSGEVRVAGTRPVEEPQRERAQHRRGLRAAKPALLGPSR